MIFFLVFIELSFENGQTYVIIHKITEKYNVIVLFDEFNEVKHRWKDCKR